MEKCYDVIIIGSGPAGLSAAIYAQRARLGMLVIEKDAFSGGQILTTYEVDNYPGFPGINGFDLGMKLRAHAEDLGAEFVVDEVMQCHTKSEIKEVVCKNNTFYAKTIVIATGATHKKLDVPGEKEFIGKGVSYCATCDGAFFKEKTVVVVGGGDVALEDAIFLSRMCKKVYIVHRRDTFRGARSLQNNVMTADNIEIVWNHIATKIDGENKIEKIMLKNTQTGEENMLVVDGVFIAVGITPNSQVFTDIEMNEQGYLIASEDTKSSVPGVFIAGDIRKKDLRQVVTAVSDGANAITSIEKYLTEIS